jgi:hypothetical protein
VAKVGFDCPREQFCLPSARSERNPRAPTVFTLRAFCRSCEFLARSKPSCRFHFITHVDNFSGVHVVGNMAINLRNKTALSARPRSGPVGGALSRKRSWLALVTFCATSAIVVALALTVLLASVTVAFAVARTVGTAAASQPQPATASQGDLSPSAIEEEPVNLAIDSFSGLVTDDHCGPRHDMGSGKSSADCARACVRNGAKFSLVDGDKNYALDGNSQDLERVSGLRVTVQGSLQGNTIIVHSVAAQ